MEARGNTYSAANIKSAFAATGIAPLNPRRILPALGVEVRSRETRTIRVGFCIPATPTHGRSILMHGRRTMNLLPDGTPLSKFKRGMVEKLVTAATAAIADNVILMTENTRLRKKAMTAEEKQSSKSRKHLSKARVISAEDVIRLQLAAAAKQKLLVKKRARLFEKKKAKEALVGKEPVRNGRPKRIEVIIEDEEVEEVEEAEELAESPQSSESESQAPDIAILAVPVPKRARVGRACAAAIIGSRGGSKSVK